VAYSWYLKMPVADIIPLVLTAILASIPVALPATFTLASALGARALRSGVSFRHASRPWMKRHRSLFSAPTRPAR
jgi:magnesium-transporting ATPase (P-type)